MRELIVAAAAALLMLPSVVGAPAPLDDPIENGDFEQPFVPREVHDALSGTPVDECVGLGHQVFYGYDTFVGTATGGPFAEPDASQADPQKAVEDAASDPIGTALYQSGYGHCVYGDDTGTDIVWFNAVDQTDKPALWSVHPRVPSTEFGYDHDDDLFDREARIVANASRANLNLWQSYVSQPGIYSARFDQLRFDVEAGQVPSQAKVQLVLSATPLERQTPYLAGYLDCVLHITDLQPDDDGTVRVGPLEGHMTVDDDSGPDQEADCARAASTYNDASRPDADRLDALGRLRIVQINVRNFNLGAEDVVIDNLAMPGTTTAADEAAAGNVHVRPDLDPGGL